jgi:hypothetical protein
MASGRALLGSVRHRSAIGTLLTVLCVLTLLGSQMFGGIAGFLCRCGGAQSLTQSDHCHGPHSELCHAPQNGPAYAEAEAHKLDCCTDCSDREEHQPVGNKIDFLQTAAASAAAPELIPVIVAELPALPSLGFLAEDTLLSTPSRQLGTVRSLGVAIRKTVALLI